MDKLLVVGFMILGLLAGAPELRAKEGKWKGSASTGVFRRFIFRGSAMNARSAVIRPRLVYGISLTATF